MIYELALAVADSLKARKYPIPVVYGPERLTRELSSSLIIIERDREQGDAFLDVQGSHRNPRKYAAWLRGAKATIFARSALAGARVSDHEADCEQYVPALFTAIQDWARSKKGAPLVIVQAGYVPPKDAGAPETWPGVAYVMRWRVPYGVYSVDYTGAGLPEGAPSGITGEVLVRRNTDVEIVET